MLETTRDNQDDDGSSVASFSTAHAEEPQDLVQQPDDPIAPNLLAPAQSPTTSTQEQAEDQESAPPPVPTMTIVTHHHQDLPHTTPNDDNNNSNHNEAARSLLHDRVCRRIVALVVQSQSHSQEVDAARLPALYAQRHHGEAVEPRSFGLRQVARFAGSRRGVVVPAVAE